MLLAQNADGVSVAFRAVARKRLRATGGLPEASPVLRPFRPDARGVGYPEPKSTV